MQKREKRKEKKERKTEGKLSKKIKNKNTLPLPEQTTRTESNNKVLKKKNE